MIYRGYSFEKNSVSEMENRMGKFKEVMSAVDPEWDMAVIFSNINLFYFTGTMQDGMLLIPRDEEPTFWSEA